MIGVSEFCKQPFMRTESVCTIAPFFWGGKICGVDVLLNAANFAKCVTCWEILEERCKYFIHS